ncbi:TetR/AcrR family transcriptional regulator [Actinoplanes sp. NPDC051633]|uniref:TetR/AcrR family transcriptional regulator n=1 Tax=Actinoplanes sp. NPDC051633 TaxID=3155670 RepID=UPI00342E74C3
MEMDISWLPPNLAVLYEPRDANRRGPRPALSLDSVVRTGIEIADAEGLGGLSMSRVAERLGFTTMSLYRYVRSKDDLLLLMADEANGREPPEPDPISWRDGLETWTRAIFRVLRAHPWLLRVPMSGPPAGPAQLRWMEAGLANLAGSGLHDGRKLQIIQLLHGYARGEAQLSSELGTLAPEADTSARYGEILRVVTTQETHPALHRLLDTGILDGPTEYDEDVDFGFGLSTILDGIERQVEAGQPTDA